MHPVQFTQFPFRIKDNFELLARLARKLDKARSSTWRKFTSKLS